MNSRAKTRSRVSHAVGLTPLSPSLRSPSRPTAPRSPTLTPSARGSFRTPRPALPHFLHARVVAPPRLHQLLPASASLLPQALFGLLGPLPLPALPVALGSALHHGAPRRGRSPHANSPAAAIRGPSVSAGVVAKKTSSLRRLLLLSRFRKPQFNHAAGRRGAIRSDNPLARIFVCTNQSHAARQYG
jgi:hypothetical protein